jgi:2-polyprenyl-6-hydroxyphenyl methylase/3-demethylubiquinone-9 3-methyltransferase
MMWRDRKSPPLAPATTADPAEIARFTALADAWWEPHGPFRTLHRLNPVRLAFIRDRVGQLMDRAPDADRLFAGLRVLDIGCGGGLLSHQRRALSGKRLPHAESGRRDGRRHFESHPEIAAVRQDRR